MISYPTNAAGHLTSVPKKRKHKKKSFIKNYGLMWRRDLVSWGSGRKKGQLLGRRKKVIDFRKQIGVYVLYNENRSAIYVGQAGQGESDRLFVRLRTHTHDRLAERWRYLIDDLSRKIDRLRKK